MVGLSNRLRAMGFCQDIFVVSVPELQRLEVSIRMIHIFRREVRQRLTRISAKSSQPRLEKFIVVCVCRLRTNC